MKNRCTLFLLLLVAMGNALAQSTETYKTPKSVSDELEIKTVQYHNQVFTYKVKYPESFSKYKKYPVMIGIPAGDLKGDMVDYSYYAWFRSRYFDDYITVIPVPLGPEKISQWEDDKIIDFYDMLRDKEPVDFDDWIVAGAADGGNAVFRFVGVYPDVFEVVFAMPGGLPNGTQVSRKWKHLEIVLAYGENDIGWNTISTNTFNTLNGEVKNVTLVEMKGQEHMVSPEYDIDEVYNVWFGK